ncbi:MAG: coenzyme F420-0:L-glutamate ligase [Chloroflexi bacterium]|nr:coenzyme F420-0:L-glutamate ligase [Chloroflexota bacterium]
MSDAPRLSLTALPGIPLIAVGADLVAIAMDGLARAALRLIDGDVLIFAQKIVSKAEGRQVALSRVVPSPRAQALAHYAEKDPRFVEVVLRESREVLRIRPGLLVVEHRLGFVCANAGVDRSNVAPHDAAEEWVLLLPENPDASCERLRVSLHACSGARVGVIINDSHGRAWRNGTVGVAVGVAGLPAVQDMRGHADLFDYTLQVTQIGAADELAAAASLLMGQADEGRPIIHARGFPYALREAGLAELLRPREVDAFR